MDATTHHLLSFAGVRCRVIGTFYMADFGADGATDWQLCFGSDISNYYPNRGLKVFKPRGEILERIANFRDPMIFLERTYQWCQSDTCAMRPPTGVFRAWRAYLCW
jgi:hypothetical protein